MKSVLTVVAALALVPACTESLEGDYGGIDGDGAGAGSGSSEGQGHGVEPGQLTAGEWDDNANFEWFSYTLSRAFAVPAGKGNLDFGGRMVTTITDGDGHAIANAKIEIVGTQSSVVTGSDGRALLLPGVDGSAETIRITTPDGATLQTAPAETIVVPGGVAARPDDLDLAFVVDATGSMGDEIRYLQAEIEHIASRVAESHPEVTTRFALIVYRDLGDDYVTRVFNFNSLASFKTNLNAQASGGGGDYPEAAEIAMEKAMTGLSWRDGNVTRLVFHVADAPPHDQNFVPFLTTARAARKAGIRIFPVAASGVALEAEYLMRSTALATLGRYIFLTDDSGIGNSHETPRIPCFRVERLATLLARTIDSELSGAFIAPAPEDILRTEGTFEGERCVWQTDTAFAGN